jgi:hypothetical protein
VPPTNDELQKIKEQIEKKQIINGLKDWDWKTLSLDNLREMDSFIRGLLLKEQNNE